VRGDGVGVCGRLGRGLRPDTDSRIAGGGEESARIREGDSADLDSRKLRGSEASEIWRLERWWDARTSSSWPRRLAESL